MPRLRDRPEDIEPNVAYELDRFAERNNTHVTFNKEASRKFLSFATSKDAIWPANFRDLNAAITYMATLAPGGRITKEVVDEEITRFKSLWRNAESIQCEDILIKIIGAEKAAALDRFEKVQLADVLSVCCESKSMSEAGRKIFAASRIKKRKTNDADRLRKYLERYTIKWADIQAKGFLRL